MLGGGAVGCELAQSFARFGTHVVLAESGEQLLGEEHPQIAQRLAHALQDDGIDVRLGCDLQRAETVAGGVRARLADGSTHVVERIVLATGRHPSTTDLGLEALGLSAGEALPVDDHGRVTGAAQAWAVGDVTGRAPYTHTASYAARVVAGNLLGQAGRTDLRAIPRVVYTDPPVASVGLDESHARAEGIDPIVACVDLGELPRAKTDGCRSGLLVLTADPARGVLVGAAVIGPTADVLIAEAVLAVRAAVPLEVLADVVHAFPTYSSAYESGYQELLERCGG